jgi:hypothetical protein
MPRIVEAVEKVDCNPAATFRSSLSESLKGPKLGLSGPSGLTIDGREQASEGFFNSLRGYQKVGLTKGVRVPSSRWWTRTLPEVHLRVVLAA